MSAADAFQSVEPRGEETAADGTPSHAQEEQCSQGGGEPPRYSVPKLEGTWTLLELVAMDLARDPRLSKVRRRDLPEAFWDERRRARNRRRTLQRKENNRRRAAGQQAEQEPQRPDGDAEAQQAAGDREVQRTEEERKQAVQAHLAKKALLEEALRSGLRVAVDCSLSHKGARWRELRSLAKQLQLSVGANKKAVAPLNLHFVGLTGPVREFAEQYMSALRWPAHLCEAPALELFPREDLVILSPDADTPLLELDPSKVYVIGGLVDRSRLKNATAAFAAEQGLAVARLPVLEFLEQHQAGGKLGAQQGQHAAGQSALPQEWQHRGAECAGQGSQGIEQPEVAQAQQLGERAQQQQEGPPVQELRSPQQQSSQTAAAGELQQRASCETAARSPEPVSRCACEPGGQAKGLLPVASKEKGSRDGKGFILNINEVVEVLLAVNAGHGWVEALQRTIPQRKQLQHLRGGEDHMRGRAAN